MFNNNCLLEYLRCCTTTCQGQVNHLIQQLNFPEYSKVKASQYKINIHLTGKEDSVLVLCPHSQSSFSIQFFKNDKEKSFKLK